MPKNKKTLVDDKIALLLVASVIAIGGLIYELILGTASSYLIGDSILSFSLGIGFSLFGMGLGSLIAIKFFKESEKRFLQNELILGLLGGYSVVILFLAFSYTQIYWVVFIFLSIAIGICIGLEIPLVVETYKKASKKESSIFLSNVLAVDYVGALIGSLLFPLVLLPYLGIVRTGLAVGALNVSVVLFLIFRRGFAVSRSIRFSAIAVLSIIICGFIFASSIERVLTAANFKDPVVYYDLSPYQRVVLTQFKQDTRLYLNNQLQFSSVDEYRYHETLAHAATTNSADIENVLILGGGDGLLARELLKYEEVKNITIVDLDPAVVRVGVDHPKVRELNHDSLRNDKVTIINQDALNYVRDLGNQSFQVVLVDLVDPANAKVAKLYSVEFYKYLNRIITDDGTVITQASSTFYTPRAFWSIHASMEEVFSDVTPLSVNVPSFGEWGFMLAKKNENPSLSLFSERNIPEGQKFISKDQLFKARLLSRELLNEKHNESSTLLRPKISRFYNEDLARWSAY